MLKMTYNVEITFYLLLRLESQSNNQQNIVQFWAKKEEM